MIEQDKLKTRIRKLQAKFNKLVIATDEEDEEGIEEIGMLEDKIERLITQYEDICDETNQTCLDRQQ